MDKEAKQKARRKRISEASRLWYHKNKEHKKRKNKMYRRSLRLEVIGAYGGKCACCGESRLEFLSIDHIHGGGNRHRKQLQKLGIDLYLWLRKHGYPPGYRVLCHNCNFSHGVYGYCPHALEKDGLLSNEADSLAGVKK